MGDACPHLRLKCRPQDLPTSNSTGVPIQEGHDGHIFKAKPYVE